MGKKSHRNAVGGLVQQRSHEIQGLTFGLNPPIDKYPEYGDGKGGYVCFACDRSTELGEPFVCISRLLQVTRNGESQGIILDAGAQLQVCLPCVLRGARHRLDWVYNPELTVLEYEAFYCYARLLADSWARHVSDTRVKEDFTLNSCIDENDLSLLANVLDMAGGRFMEEHISILGEGICPTCKQKIDTIKPHVLVEIEVNIPRIKHIDVDYVWPLGKYCNACSVKLMPQFE